MGSPAKPQSFQLISIEINADGTVQFSVPQATREFLLTLREEIILICAVGPYRCGKSWMLGKLSNQPNAFITSNGSQACTRGIHVNSEPFSSKRLMFLDTEGLGAPGSNVEIDSKILACATLFAAKVYFFVVGKIDTKVLDSLQCAIGTANWLKDAANQQCFAHQKPQLVVVIKDITLQLQDDAGNKASPNEYFNSCLEKYCATNNSELKSAIASLFSDVSCLTMTIPCQDQDMKEMKNLYPKFQTDVANVLRNAYNHTKPKYIAENTPMNGPIVLQMAEQLCAALSQPGAPRLRNVWEAAMEQAALERRHKAILQFRNKLQQQNSNSLLLHLSSFAQDELQTCIEDALVKSTTTPTVKIDDVLQLLRAIKNEAVELDTARVNARLELATTQPLAQWTSQCLPTQVSSVLLPTLQGVEKLQSDSDELKRELGERENSLALLESQIATLTTPSVCDDVPQATITDLETKLEDARRKQQQSQAYAEEVMIIHTTFQNEMKEQVIKNAERNEQLVAELQQTNTNLHAAQQDVQSLTRKLEELSRASKDDKTRINELSTERKTNENKRKLDELQFKQLEAKVTGCQQRETDFKRRYEQAQQEIQTKDEETRVLRLELLRTHCSSIYSSSR